MTLEVVPMTLREARAYVAEHHRHHLPPQGGLFAIGASDGWYLRSDIIWSKPNSMPESVTDRPTKAHEYLFLLTKSARYYFDANAVREPHKWQDSAELAINPQARQQKRLAERAQAGDTSALRTQDTYQAAIRGERGKGRYADVGAEQNYSMSPAGRNIRSVWNIATRPYPGAHFAVFPPELPERCIKAGSSEKGVCPSCGAPWERIQEKGEVVSSYVGTDNPNWHEPAAKYVGVEHDREQRRNPDGVTINQTSGWKHLPRRERFTTGWRPSCGHGEAPTVFDAIEASRSIPHPAVILDPFGGSGTVGMVANRLSRRAILIDLNPEYLKQQMKRNAQTPLGLPA